MKRVASFLMMGLGVGWIVGLSVTSVVQTVLTSVLGIVAGALAGLSSLREVGEQGKEKSRITGAVDPRPAGLLLMGLAVAVSFGVLARTHHWLEPSLSSEVDGWARLGLPKTEIAKRLLDRDLPPATAVEASATQQGDSRSRRDVGVLFATGVEECQRLQTVSGPRLRNTMLASSAPWARRIAETVEEPGLLKTIVNAVCAED